MRAAMVNHLRGFSGVKLRREYCRDAVEPSFEFSDTTVFAIWILLEIN